MAMDAQLQQRIVGAVVLVTLGVIFIPALLDGSGYEARQIQDIEISDRPEFPPLSQKQLEPIPTPVQANREEYEQRSEKSGSDSVKRVPADKPVQAFALQVGTFENEGNAEKLRDKMKKAGYSAFVTPGGSGGKTSYRVRIGPSLDRAQLEKNEADIKKTFKIDGYIVNHP